MDDEALPREGAAAVTSEELLDELYPDAPPPAGEGPMRAELGRLNPRLKWCPELGAGAEPSALPGMWDRVGEAELRARARAHLGARAAWAAARAAEDPELWGAAAREAARADRDATAHALVAALEDSRRTPPGSMDADPWALGTPGGLVDLRGARTFSEAEAMARDGELDPADLGDMEAATVTMRTGGYPGDWEDPVDPDPEWEACVDEVCCHDAEKAAFLQRALGYSLLGANPEKAVFLLLGTTRDNGKSTVMNAVRAAMGDYARSVPSTFLTKRRFDDDSRADPVLASLKGIRLVDVAETAADSRLDEAKLKKLSSGTDEVTCRALRRDPFSYTPGFTIWMHVNRLPEVADPTALAAGKVHVITFDRHFAPEERDLGLPERLAEPWARDSIMRWLMEGWRDYLDQGLNPPACVREASAAWEAAAGDPFDRFVAERVDLRPGARTPTSDMLAAFRAYLSAGGEDAASWTAAKLSRRFAKIGAGARPFHGERCYAGAALREGYEPADIAPGTAESVPGDGGNVPEGADEWAPGMSIV